MEKKLINLYIYYTYYLGDYTLSDNKMANEKTIIREANIGDLERLLDLYDGFYRELRLRQGLVPRHREDYHSDVNTYLSRDKVFLAETSGSETIGFIHISEREGCYWIEELYVKPGYRGKGIGKKLVEKAENYIKEHDSHVYMMVLPQDRKAVSFWSRMGYQILNTVELAKSLE